MQQKHGNTEARDPPRTAQGPLDEIQWLPGKSNNQNDPQAVSVKIAVSLP